MTTSAEFDSWSAARSYEHYMGRWSRRIAAEFIAWMAPSADAAWLEIGCGTGALTATILSRCEPGSILSIDPSADFVAHARSAIDDPRVRFEVADALNLPADNASTDVVSSGLVLNFVPDPVAALAEAQRVLRPGGLATFYVWDYPGGGIGFIDAFWKAASELDPAAGDLDESKRFPFCTRDGLATLCESAGMRSPAVTALEIETVFPQFDAFWQPFTLGAGPAPGYCMSLGDEQRTALRARLADAFGQAGKIRLTARAWAVKAHRT